VTSGHSEKRGSFLSQKANWISSMWRNQTNFKNSISTLMIINYILKIEL